MQLADVDEVMRIERVSFPTPWSASAYRYELRHNNSAHYFVARPQLVPPPEVVRDSAPEKGGWRGLVQRWLPSAPWREPGRGHRPPVLGYGGFWMMAGEAHISTIAVRPEHRRRGIGELLLVAMIDRATELDAEVMTLEVRISNIAAQSLYRKYGFRQVGLRKGYYSDNRESALIMTTERITSAAFQSQLQGLKRALREKLIAAAMGSPGLLEEAGGVSR
ncbi:MAG TPA: ribosomal-protein-alanine N-acetyltransferase [Anaerolineae bacterium]|nr:ribosomal-protein-alanine N-acetyltransferase [Anaerolineae bacterium]